MKWLLALSIVFLALSVGGAHAQRWTCKTDVFGVTRCDYANSPNSISQPYVANMGRVLDAARQRQRQQAQDAMAEREFYLRQRERAERQRALNDERLIRDLEIQRLQLEIQKLKSGN